MKTILLVEDDPNMGMLVQLALEGKGTVEHLMDGKAAAERIASGPPPDVVLLDVGLPGLSGHEVLQRIRDEEATRGIPVLMLTAHDKERVASSGGPQPDAYLGKPFDIDELGRVVDQLLAGGAP